MLDPHTSMSLTAVLVLTVVVLVTVLGWLAAVFLAGHQPRGGSARPGREDPADRRAAGTCPPGLARTRRPGSRRAAARTSRWPPVPATAG